MKKINNFKNSQFTPNMRYKLLNEEEKIRKTKGSKYNIIRCVLYMYLPEIYQQLPNTFSGDFFYDMLKKNLKGIDPYVYDIILQPATERWIKEWYLRIRSDYFRQLSSDYYGINLRFTKGKCWQKNKYILKSA